MVTSSCCKPYFWLIDTKIPIANQFPSWFIILLHRKNLWPAYQCHAYIIDHAIGKMWGHRELRVLNWSCQDCSGKLWWIIAMIHYVIVVKCRLMTQAFIKLLLQKLRFKGLKYHHEIFFHPCFSLLLVLWYIYHGIYYSLL